MAQVLIVDDESLTRDILRDYVEADSSFEVVGEAANGSVAIQQAKALRPDVILMDMQMPVMDGVEATARIHAEQPEIAILGMSTFSSDRYVVDLLRAGASGYLVKDSTPAEVTAAIHAILAGESVLSPEVTRHVVRGLEKSVPADQPADESITCLLTDKEREVIDLLAAGMSNSEMAQHLYVSESTIKARFVKIMEKLGVRDRVQILVTAIAHRLVTIDGDPQFGPRA